MAALSVVTLISQGEFWAFVLCAFNCVHSGSSTLPTSSNQYIWQRTKYRPALAKRARVGRRCDESGDSGGQLVDIWKLDVHGIADFLGFHYGVSGSLCKEHGGSLFFFRNWTMKMFSRQMCSLLIKSASLHRILIQSQLVSNHPSKKMEEASPMHGGGQTPLFHVISLVLSSYHRSKLSL